MSEWRSEQLDLETYLGRIGFVGSRSASGAALTALHRAHRAAIPFENLDVVTGRGVDTSIEAIQTKLVDGTRGGYCFEHGVLFSAVLERFGFAVDRLLGRVGAADGPVRPRTHMVLHVTGDDGTWLADVGFGGGLLEPLAWVDGSRGEQGGWTYELARCGPRHWELRESCAEEHHGGIYHFTDDAQHPIDVVVANHYVSTHPNSPFVGKPVVMHKRPGEQKQLIGRTLTVSGPGRPDRVRDVRATEFGGVLQEEFGLQVSRDQVRGIRRRLPSG